MEETESIKQEILRLTRIYSKKVHTKFRPASDPIREQWKKGTPIPYAGRVFDEREVEAAVSSTLDFWLTLGIEGEKFQEELKEYLGVKNCLLVNSGSSANLIAINTLTSNKIDGKRRIRKGDEVISVAAGFPTTVAPIVQVGAIPVLIDADSITGNANCKYLEEAYTKGKTKAVMMAHALGNPFDISSVLRFCRKYNLWLIEDNCDALGCTYSMPIKEAEDIGIFGNSPGVKEEEGLVTRWTGTWGDISTQSFYPPHHLTMGEGGCVNIVNDKKLKVIAESIRDWGRDCWCPSGIDNTCNKRFGWKLGELPEGYDHKYTYSHLGYNLKPLDVQAAIGRIQLNRLSEFVQARKVNWTMLRTKLADQDRYLEFSLPTHAKSWKKDNIFTWDESGCKTDCSWFGFKIAVKREAPFTRNELAKELDNKLIGNRMLFGGNLVRQPAFVDLLKEDPKAIKINGEMKQADNIMNDTLFIGTYPGLTTEQIDYIAETIIEFIKIKTSHYK